MNKQLCIYHKGCLDGFASAWVVSQAHPGIPLHEGVYQDDPPNVTGLDVIIVDFSYKRDVLIEMSKTANSILIIDHHKSAKADLQNLPDNIDCKFDITHSGAGLTWMHYFPNENAPKLLQHIEDRDLWRFTLKNTQEIVAAMYSRGFTLELFDTPLAKLASEGVAITRANDKNISSLAKTAAYRLDIDGHNVPICNAPYMFASDMGNLLAKGEPFSATYYDTEDYRIFSLRSDENGLDVSIIAEKFGGGGHEHAAGFRVQRPIFERTILQLKKTFIGK